jgi:tetratricopeptide (TPR) repeat protein/DNA-binding XRE family transcriptional regulator
MATHQVVPFAGQLRRFRRDRELTQEELAEQAGLSARGIRALELGERGAPHKDTVRLLASALGLTPHQRVAFEQAASVAASGPAQGGPAPPVGGFLGAVPVGSLIARQDEVSRLVGVLDEVTGGAGRLIMLVGEPGVGKTRLAQEVTVAARARKYLVATGRCYEPEQSVPYYPFLGALVAVYDAAPASIRAGVPKRWPYLEWLLPDRLQTAGVSELSDQGVQQRLFWAVSAFLQAVAAAAPVALLLDDLHWADESSLRLLQHLARESRGSRVLLLGTHRDVEVGRQHPLERTLHELHREGLLEGMRVRRLEQAGTAALAAAVLGGEELSQEFAQLVHARTEGNSFFTQEVMRALIERGDVFRRDRAWDCRALEGIEVPRSVRSAIGERVSRLSSQAQEVLHEASVLGQAFSFEDLWRMGKRGEEGIEEALEEALAAMLVRATSADEYTFNHVLTQQALYSELSLRRRNRLHLAIGEALAQLREPARRGRAAQTAWHFLQAHLGERALPVVIRAGDEAEAVFAHSEAEQHYRTALDLVRELVGPAREVEAEVLEKLGIVLRRVARYDEALDVLERAAELSARTVDIAGEARATHEGAMVHYYKGTQDLGLVRIRALTERLEQHPLTAESSRALVDLYTALAVECLWPTARYTEALSATERAVELARTADYARSPAAAEAATMRGMTLTMVGPLSDARVVLEEAGLLCATSKDRWWMINSVGNAGRAYLDEGEFGKGSECLERCRALIDAWQDRAEMAWVESNMGEVAYLQGAWVEARAKYEGAIRIARDVDSGRYLSYALLHLAELCAGEGNWEDAQGHIEEGLALGRLCSAVPAVRKAQRLLAEHDLAEGRPEQAVSRLQPLLGSPEHECPRAFPPPVLAEAYLDLGEVAKAEDLVLQRVRRFRAHGHRRALALWLRIQGKTLGQQQRWDEAERVFSEAASLADAMPYPYAEGRVLYESGLMQMQRGEPEQAPQRLEEALAIFRGLGAGPSIERAQLALHRLE